MTVFRINSSLKRLLAGICILIVLYSTLSQIFGLALFNLAQIGRLRTAIRSEFYLMAVKLSPDNGHIRWQTGIALALVGDLTKAANTLLPLLNHPHTEPEAILQTFNVLITAGKTDEALHLYQQMHYPPVVSPNAAAIFISLLEQRSRLESISEAEHLWWNLFGINIIPQGNGLLKDSLSERDIELTQFDQQLQTALKWRIQKCSHSPISNVLNNSYENYVASLMGMPSENVTLDKDLVKNGNFELYDFIEDEPVGWRPNFASTGNPWNLAAFVVGMDNHEPFAGGCSLRVDGLLLEKDPQLEPARAGFIHSAPLLIKKGKPYAISFAYRTEQGEDSVSLWLSENSKVLFGGDKFFPDTSDKWKLVTIISWNRSGKDATIHPLLRLWSKGTVWFDNFSIRPLLLNTSIEPGEAIIDVRNAQ